MEPEELKKLQEKAALWDSLGKPLMDMYGSPIKAVKMECEITKEGYLRVPETIQNTSNASSFVGLLEEEEYEWVSIGEERIKLTIPPQSRQETKDTCIVRDFDEDIKKYENELYCSMCGNDNKCTFIYDRSVSNGEVWNCKDCGRENIVNHEPKEDDY